MSSAIVTAAGEDDIRVSMEAALRQCGEWFKDDGTILAFVAEQKAAGCCVVAKL